MWGPVGAQGSVQRLSPGLSNSADPAFVVRSLMLSEVEAGHKKEDSATIVITGNIPCRLENKTF